MNSVANAPNPPSGIVDLSSRTKEGTGNLVGSFLPLAVMFSVQGTSPPCSSHSPTTPVSHCQQSAEHT